MTCTKCGGDKDVSEFPTDKRKRNGKSSWCKGCHRAKDVRWHADNPTAKKKYDQQDYQRRHVQRRAQAVGARLLARYGITLEQYEALLAAQEGRCGICRTDKPGGRGRFHVDHNHETGEIRGLLCTPCNLRLGVLEDESWMTKALAWIRKQ